jgi:hypothetical protein
MQSHRFIQTNLTNPGTRTKPFRVWFSPTPFVIASLLDNAKRVAAGVANTPRPVFLSLSGGLDSEFVLKTFSQIGARITPIIVVSPFNSTESDYALSLCELYNTPPVVLRYDSKPAFIAELYSRARQYNINSLISCVTMLAAEYAMAYCGDLVTGHCDPFGLTTTYGTIRTVDSIPIPEMLEICEYDFYIETFFPTLTGSLLGIDAGVYYALLSEISHTLPYEEAKAGLYDIPTRKKSSWDIELYTMNARLLQDSDRHYNIPKSHVMQFLSQYKI